MDSIRWGIIGCGNVTEVKSGPAFQKIEGSELVAVMRRDGDKARDYAFRHGVHTWYDDADKLIDDPQVNAVYIATPPSSHAEYTLKAADAGKVIYVEKPMARTHEECQRMIEACKTARVPLFVAYYRRRLPAFLKVKELLQIDAIGEGRLAQVTLFCAARPEDYDPENLPWRVRPEISGGGYFFDLASHQLDYLDFLLGPIRSARGHVSNQAGMYPAEDVVCASFGFESGVVGSGVWCFSVHEKNRTDQIELLGSKGKISFPTFDTGPIKLATDSGVEEFRIPKPEHIQQPLIQSIVDELRGKGKCPSTGVTAARTSWAMDEIVKYSRKIKAT